MRCNNHACRVADWSIASSMNKTMGSPCSEDSDGNPHAGKIMGRSIPDLPEDIWRHIHSLLPLRDAARAACLSRAFLCSWRCHPNLIFTVNMLGLKAHTHRRSFSQTVDHILSNHSAVGVKRLQIELDNISFRKLDNWLQAAVTPGIIEITLTICEPYKKYKFPCSLLSEGVRKSIKFLDLGFCAFHPTTELGTLRSLTSLSLFDVRIEGGELECLLSKSPVLEQLDIAGCNKIICLKIPFMLERLICLKVWACPRLRVIENQAPNLSSLEVMSRNVNLIGETLQVKNLIADMFGPKGFCYTLAKLSSIMPNLETIAIKSGDEVVNTLMPPTKLLYLKHLSISVTSGTRSPPYDYFSLVPFIDASPSLETLSMDVITENQKHESVLGLPSPWRQMAEHHHRSLRSVRITGFSCAKSLVELTCYILKNAVSLKCLALDTVPSGLRCHGKNHKPQLYESPGILSEAHTAVVAIRTHIKDKVPSGVELTVGEPCSQCRVAPPPPSASGQKEGVL